MLKWQGSFLSCSSGKTVSRTLQHNGVIERMKGVIIGGDRCKLRTAQPWGETFRIAYYLVKISPLVLLELILDSVWIGKMFPIPIEGILMKSFA